MKFIKSWKFITDYTENSTIQGVKYIGSSRHIAEKIFWVISITFCFCLCSFTITQIYQKWKKSPVIVTFADKAMSISQIPFPAVTICPKTKFDRRILNYTELYHVFMEGQEEKLTHDQLRQFEAAALICHPKLQPYKETLINISKLDSHDIIWEIIDISIIDDNFISCLLRNRDYKCQDIFSPILTEEGLCLTFNMLDLTELMNQDALTDDIKIFNNEKFTAINWTLQDGYTTKSTDAYPRRALGAGLYGGLQIVLQTKKSDKDFLCTKELQGFQITFHNPAEFPTVRKNFYLAGHNEIAYYNVNPDMITTSNSLKKYSIRKRQCYFDGERNLKFFNIYTQNNCALECIANYTLNKCGCVTLWMVRLNDTRVCTLKDYDCYYSAEDEVFEDMNEDIESSVESSDERLPENCNCLPSCTSLNYNVESSQVLSYVEQLIASLGNTNNVTLSLAGIEATIINIQFKENQFFYSQRNELYDWGDFIANCGGLMGLFMGVSLVSIIEIIYHLSLRLYCNLKVNRKTEPIIPIYITDFKL